MRYEPFLFTRNQRQDFTAFVRPALLTNKDVSAIGAIFNYVTDVSRLTAEFPSLYYFPLGEYLLLLRHYNSGRTHAGRAIGVIEGIALKRENLDSALPQFIDQQAELLDVSGTVADIESDQPEAAAEQDWQGQASDLSAATFAGEFLIRRAQDRLFLPFTARGRDLLTSVQADRRFRTPLFFAFGTNSDVLAQLERYAPVDIVSFFKTDRCSFRSRVTNSVTGAIHDPETDAAPDPSMSVRPVERDETRLRPIIDEEEDEDTMVGKKAFSIRSFKPSQAEPVAEAEPDESEEAVEDADDEDDEDDEQPTVLTMRQLRDQLRAQEAAAAPETAPLLEPHDPLHWLLHLVSSFFSPHKPE